MRLLNARSLIIHDFPDDRAVPPYAILSHTWGADEVLYQDLVNIDRNQFQDRVGPYCPLPGDGFAKVFATCRQAQRDNIEYVWIDTCCINKESSAELSEAINSMFRFYQNSKVCYVHLCDITYGPQVKKKDLQQARWFTRGWTLQELIAPRRVEFFDRDWKPIGHLVDMLAPISRITGIQPSMFRNGGANLDKVSVATKMSWASKRQTTRVEDEAYCLLGIFNVNMPMLYGEGSKAFARLQEEIIKISSDHTIFAWRAETVRPQLLAPSPAAFMGSSNFVPGEPHRQDGRSFEMTNRGLRISLPVIEVRAGLTYAVLNCSRSDMEDTCIGLRIDNAVDGEGRGTFKSEKEFNLCRSVCDKIGEDCTRINVFRRHEERRADVEVLSRPSISGRDLKDYVAGRHKHEQDLILRRLGPVQDEDNMKRSDCRRVRIMTYDRSISILHTEPLPFWDFIERDENTGIEAVESIFAVGPAWGCQCSMSGHVFTVFYAYDYDQFTLTDKYYLRVETKGLALSFADTWTWWNDKYNKTGRNWPNYRCNELPTTKTLVVAADQAVDVTLDFSGGNEPSMLMLHLNVHNQDGLPGDDPLQLYEGIPNPNGHERPRASKHARSTSLGSKLMSLMSTR